MLHAKITSSNIFEAFLDDTTLILGFNNGRYYAYSDFPRETWDRFLTAESQGKFFHAEIMKKFVGVECASPHADVTPATEAG